MSPIFYICNANVVDARVRHTRRFPFFLIPRPSISLIRRSPVQFLPVPFAAVAPFVSLKRLPFCIPSYARACPPVFS